ncbi:MAG: hypothetical protein ACK53T_00210 [Planctomycetota bacterium]
MMDRIVELERRVNEAFIEGYRRGENERIWLATANSELRSVLRELGYD